MERDKHDQPDIGIHYKNNVAKKLNELIGICRGIAANHKVSDKEFQYLHAWLKDNAELHKDADYIDLLDITSEIAQKEIVDPDDFNDLLDQISCVLEFKCEANTPFETSDIAIGRLIGLARGFLSDGDLEVSEIVFLYTWLEKCSAFDSVWPISEIKKDVEDILSDGVISEDERYFLAKKLQGLVGGDFFETGVTSGFSANFYCDDIDRIEFENSEFCLTGQFLFGNREACRNKLSELGARFVSNPKKSTDYLVVGALSSRDWKQTSHGRKIEKAIELRDSGQNIILLHEDTWVKCLI